MGRQGRSRRRWGVRHTATKAELEIEVEYLKGQLSEKEGELATANEQITERDGRIEDLNQQIADANEGHDENRVADLERQIAEKDVALGELSAKVTDLEMNAADPEVNDQADEELRQLREKVEMRESDTRVMEVQRNEYRDKVIGLEARIKERDSLHGSIDNLTAPY